VLPALNTADRAAGIALALEAPEPHRKQPVRKEVTTYARDYAHKEDLFLATLIGKQSMPVMLTARERTASRAPFGSEARA
jgi:hypothetical protein